MADPFAAQVVIDHDRAIGEISPLLFGGFAEHMGRCIYQGIYEPMSPLAGARGGASWRGSRSRATSSAPTSFWSSVVGWGVCRCLVSTSARARFETRRT